MFLAKIFMPLLDDAKKTDQTNNTPCISISNGIKLKITETVQTLSCATEHRDARLVACL
jgi:hypothetical protein